MPNIKEYFKNLFVNIIVIIRNKFRRKFRPDVAAKFQADLLFDEERGDEEKRANGD